MSPFDQLRTLFRKMADGDMSLQGAEMEAQVIIDELEEAYNDLGAALDNAQHIYMDNPC